MNVQVQEISSRQQRWIERWEQGLDQRQEQEQNVQPQHEVTQDPPSEIQHLQGRITDLERSRAAQAAEIKFLRLSVQKVKDDEDRLRGLHLEGLDVDELQQLNSTIQEASERVRRALERREAEVALAHDKNLCCPIGIGLLRDPVVAADGHTYERDKIEAWFASRQFADCPVKSPMTNIQLNDTTLIPNHALKSVIHDAVDNKIASMRARKSAVSPTAEVDESVGTVRTC
jgi:hypothetical protein